MTELPDFEFSKRFRRLIVEQLALEAVRGGSWKKALDELRKNLPEILEVEQSDIEREIASLLEIRGWDSEGEDRSRPDENNEPIDQNKERRQRQRGGAGEKRPGMAGNTAGSTAGNAAPHGGNPNNSSGSPKYGEGVRRQVFEVVVRQGMKGAPWRSICAGPLATNNIDPEDVQAEIDRRLKMLGGGGAGQD